ncbi:MAG: hypothetical protein U0235_20605 [Polyangiaceae bacterium]
MQGLVSGVGESGRHLGLFAANVTPPVEGSPRSSRTARSRRCFTSSVTSCTTC